MPAIRPAQAPLDQLSASPRSEFDDVDVVSELVPVQGPASKCTATVGREVLEPGEPGISLTGVDQVG